MLQPPEFFGEQELDLLFIAKKLREAQTLESLLTEAEIDYAVEVDEYRGGFIFQTVRKGAFFYVRPEDLAKSREVAVAGGFKPQEEPASGDSL
jgi:hypothetical protein